LSSEFVCATYLGASRHYTAAKLEHHGKQCRLTITPMGRTALALGGKAKTSRVTAPASAAAG
jgi:hypothetical protein